MELRKARCEVEQEVRASRASEVAKKHQERGAPTGKLGDRSVRAVEGLHARTAERVHGAGIGIVHGTIASCRMNSSVGIWRGSSPVGGSTRTTTRMAPFPFSKR